jgi:hypothetical protein
MSKLDHFSNAELAGKDLDEVAGGGWWGGCHRKDYCPPPPCPPKDCYKPSHCRPKC